MILSLTLDEITNKMRKAYFEETKKDTVPYSDTDNRIKAVATELFSVYSYADYIFRQAFPQTATGVYLDYHAELRGLGRKKATQASGILTFFTDIPAEVDAVIPKGTVCSAADMPFIQFETQEDAVISTGETSVNVKAKAIETGERFNVLPNQIDTIVNPPKYISGVMNPSEFQGGTDDETDESLRGRVLEIYKWENNALNEASVKKMIIGCDDVLDAHISLSSNVFSIVLKTASGEIKDSTKKQILERLSFSKLFNCRIDFILAKAKNYTVEVNIKAYSGADFDEISQLAESRINDFCGAGKIGRAVRSYDLAKTLADLPYTEDINISLTPSAGDTVACGTNEYLKLYGLQVNVYE